MLGAEPRCSVPDAARCGCAVGATDAARRRRSDYERPGADGWCRAHGASRSTSRCSLEAEPFQAGPAWHWTDRPPALRSGRTGGAVPARRRIRPRSRCGGPRRRFQSRPVETPTPKTSGFEIDLGEPITIDRFRIDGLAPPFLKRVRLEGSGDRARWTLLVAEGTVFNLPEERLVQTELAFTPGPYRYLRLTWDDTRSGRLPQPASSSAREVRNVMRAAGADDAARVRAATERAGPQPVSAASAGGAAADRGPRHRHGRHPRPARGDGLRSPIDRRPGRADHARRGHVEAGRAGRGDRVVTPDSYRRRRSSRSSISSSTMATTRRAMCAASPRSSRTSRGSISNRPATRSSRDTATRRCRRPIRPRGRAPDARHQHDDGRDVG